MGLDMYLHKGNAKDGEEVMYWRKANQIHGWFERHCGGGSIENCEPVRVTRGDLATLIAECVAVILSCELVDGDIVVGHRFNEDGEYVPILEKGKVVKDALVAATLMPPTDGFFFGGDSYDEWYVRDLEETIEGLKKVLEESDEDDTFEYYAWW